MSPQPKVTQPWQPLFKQRRIFLLCTGVSQAAGNDRLLEPTPLYIELGLLYVAMSLSIIHDEKRVMVPEKSKVKETLLRKSLQSASHGQLIHDFHCFDTGPGMHAATDVELSFAFRVFSLLLAVWRSYAKHFALCGHLF